MLKKLIIVLCLGAAAGAAWVALKPARSSSAPLTVFCAAGIKKPVEEIATAYQKETGTEVRLQYGGTGTLLSQLKITNQGDLFIAADDGALADAKKLGVTREEFPLVIQKPVLSVAKGNPKHIDSLAALKNPDVKLALANPEAASIGRVVKKLLGPEWDALAAKAAVMKPTVTEIAADLSLGAVDAAIVWDSVIPQFKGLETAPLPELAKHEEHATATILSSSQQPAEALRFARYLTAPEKGGSIFKKQGFNPVPGDKWASRPDLIIYSGGVNRPAIEKLLHQFANREGISMTTVFNGCGILCASMKTMGDSSNPKYPDVYYACDVCFVPPVAEQFPEAILLTEAEIVIAVPKGNPQGIHTLADLARPGLRVGLCNAEQSTIGFLTRSILKSMNLWESVSKNASSQVPTADFLVNQMRTGSLDAAIVYGININNDKEHFEAIPLPADKSKAVQPFAVRKDTPNRQMGQRLLAFLRENHTSFETAGFVWKGDTAPVKSADIVLPDWLKQK